MTTPLLLGFDIGGTKCAAVLGRRIGNTMTVVGRLAFATAETPEPTHALERLARAGETLIAEHHATISAIGIACGGPLDSAAGLVLGPPNLPGWDRVEVCAFFAARFGVPARLENDANAGALAEWRWGAGRGAQHVVYLTFGTGLGAGLILDGRLYRGANDLAGEVGHLRLCSDGPEGYGKRGSFEGFCSGGGIARALRETGKALSAAQAAVAANAGESELRRFFSAVGERLGEGLALLVDVLNPERIVIGGIFTRQRALLWPSAAAALAREALPLALARCHVVDAALGEQVGDLACLAVAPGGAASIATDHPVLNDLARRHPVLADCRSAVARAATLIRDCHARGGKVLVCGNGGSAADSDHLVGELGKGFLSARGINDADRATLEAVEPRWRELAPRLQAGMAAFSLASASALATAIANDQDPELIFAQQVNAAGQPGDVLIALSTSGNSRNVLRALEVARLRGLGTIGLCSERPSGMDRLCDVLLKAPASTTCAVQELHLPLYHTVCALVEAENANLLEIA